MRASMFIVILVVLVGLTASGCTGYMQNMRCRPEMFNTTVCYDASGRRHEFYSRNVRWESPAQREERWQRQNIIDNARRYGDEEMRVNAYHAKRMMALCRQGRLGEMSGKARARCQQLRAAGRIR